MGWSNIAFIVLIALVALTARAQAPDQPLRAVTKIVDGDGIWVEGLDKQVRLYGVDAPEMDEPDGPRAKQVLANLVEGKSVRVEEQYRDNFGRIIGRVWLGDKEVNAELIRLGPATEYCRYSKGAYGTC